MKFAYIMRGIPGSGKSTVARQLASQGAIHSTDDLCMVNGEYQFDTALAPERHAQNLFNFVKSLEAGVYCVVVDNTNVKVQQYEPYVKAAREHGYVPIFVEMAHPTLEEATERNTHGVPREVINQMIMDWEPAQHCVTVAKVDAAYETVKALQTRTRGMVFFAFGSGGALVLLIVLISAWLRS